MYCSNKTIPSPCSFPVLLDPSIMDTLKHKCFLEELLFWTIKYEFPQKMVTFLLNMLPDQDYKVFSAKLLYMQDPKLILLCLTCKSAVFFSPKFNLLRSLQLLEY